MDPAVRNFLFYNTSTTGYIFVEPEKLTPCGCKVESAVRRALLPKKECLKCHEDYTIATPLPELKKQIMEWCNRNNSNEYNAAKAYLDSVYGSQFEMPAPAPDAQQVAINQATRELWQTRAIVLIIFIFFLWNYGFIKIL